MYRFGTQWAQGVFRWVTNRSPAEGECNVYTVVAKSTPDARILRTQDRKENSKMQKRRKRMIQLTGVQWMERKGGRKKGWRGGGVQRCNAMDNSGRN